MSIQRLSSIVAGAALAGCAATLPTTQTDPSINNTQVNPPATATIRWDSDNCQIQMSGRSDARRLADKAYAGATSLNSECVAVTFSAKANPQLPTWTAYGQMFTPNCNNKMQDIAGKVGGFFSNDAKRAAAADARECVADKASLRQQLWGYVAQQRGAYAAEYKLAVPTTGGRSAQDNPVGVTFDSTADISELTSSGSVPVREQSAPAIPGAARNIPGVRDAERVIRNPQRAIPNLVPNLGR